MDHPRRTNIGRAAGRGALAAIIAGSLCAAAFADVRTSTQTRAYGVGGTTAGSLVSYMRSNPFHGARGDAVASIRPSYALDISSRQSGGTCRATNVALNIRFVMTLPQARNAAAMSASTRAAWNAFVAFTKRHEETHRSIYVQCGNAFVAKAERLTASTCASLEASIKRLLETEKAVCESRQRAFDRADYGKVGRLALFKMAGSTSRASR